MWVDPAGVRLDGWDGLPEIKISGKEGGVTWMVGVAGFATWLSFAVGKTGGIAGLLG